MKSERLHEGPGVNRRPALPLSSITKNFGIQMAHAGPSSSSSIRKPAKQKQKQNVKKTKKSVLGRQTVELLDKTALEYVHVQLTLHSTPC